MNSSFVESIKSILPSLSIADREVLIALAKSPYQSATAGELRQVLGLTNVVVVNGAMGRVGRKLHAAHGAHPDGLLSGEFEWWHMIASGEPTKDRGFVWTLKHEVLTALVDCGYLTLTTTDILTVSDDLLPASSSSGAETREFGTIESVNLTAPILEGAVNTVNLTIRERSRKARDRCIKKYGWNCAVCDVNFENIYGSIGKGFIHVHHLELLSSSNDMREVDPEADLIPVCPNCHAMVHRRTPPISMEEIKTLIEAQKVRRALPQ